jgi:hypothetical protein
MAIPSWPGSVRYVPQYDNFDVGQLYTPPAVNQPEDGPPIMRRWSAEKDAFVTFVRTTLNHGSSRFSMRVGNRGDGDPAFWPVRTCWLEGGKVQGPKPYGSNHYVVKFDLNVLDW